MSSSNKVRCYGGSEPFSYTGQPYDSATGLYLFGARYYDSSLGRFVTQDTHSGSLSNPTSLNLYVYAVDNPLTFIDPTGHDAWALGIAIGLDIVAGACILSVACDAIAPGLVGAAISTTAYVATNSWDDATGAGATGTAVAGFISGEFTFGIGEGAGGALEVAGAAVDNALMNVGAGYTGDVVTNALSGQGLASIVISDGQLKSLALSSALSLGTGAVSGYYKMSYESNPGAPASTWSGYVNGFLHPDRYGGSARTVWTSKMSPIVVAGGAAVTYWTMITEKLARLEGPHS